jgi:uncharacterized protein YjiS (DUF1127 family)
MAHAMNLTDYAGSTKRLRILSRLRRTFADHRKYLTTCDELNALSDHELADLGMSRLNVRDVAREAVYGL